MSGHQDPKSDPSKHFAKRRTSRMEQSSHPMGDDEELLFQIASSMSQNAVPTSPRMSKGRFTRLDPGSTSSVSRQSQRELFVDNEDQSDTASEDSDGFIKGPLARSSTLYDHAAEKQISHAEAKLLFQKSHVEAQNTGGSWSSFNQDGLSRSRTLSSPVRDGATLSRTDNNRSNSSALGLSQAGNTTSTADGNIKDEKLEGQRFQSLKYEKPTGPTTERMEKQDGLHGFGQGPLLDHAEADFTPDATVSAELKIIYEDIQTALDIRRKYIDVSVQGQMGNPKNDDESWQIYPPPPAPSYREAEGTTMSDSFVAMGAAGSSLASRASQKSGSSGAHSTDAPQSPKAQRKPGTNIGGDFDLNDLLPLPESSTAIFELDKNGVYQVYKDASSVTSNGPITKVPTLKEYYMDLEKITALASAGPNKSFCFRRLQYLEGSFNLYWLLHEYQENMDSKAVSHRDFYNVRKVDTHVHHSACMNQKHLLRFIKSKMKKFPDDPVLRKPEEGFLTLREVFESLGMTAFQLSIDRLDMHAHSDSFHRFDKFNLKYNPIGESRLRTVFLKTDNDIGGRYLAEVTREVISDLESSKYQMVEWRISIYGRNVAEWDKLAAWVIDHKLISHNVRWLIQIPRLYNLYQKNKEVSSFEDIINNVFRPLFEVTKDPSSHPKLHIFLQRVIGFDSVDDESKAEPRYVKKFPVPHLWTNAENPPYSYWIYYLYANMTSLNAWRQRRKFNTFVLRPHCGEAGDPDHLCAAFQCCHSISHGLLLRKMPFVQYLFYLDQIGIAMSPLSNNALFLTYDRNPFVRYFKRGLNVSLSTDDPLQFAFTKEPLIEEYAVAAQIYKLSATDMCELARNSVAQSGYEHSIKKHWLGASYRSPGVPGNNPGKTNVPDIRVAHRHSTLMQELEMIRKYTVRQPSLSDSQRSQAQYQAGSKLSASQSSAPHDQFSQVNIPQPAPPSHHSPTFLAQQARIPASQSSTDMSAHELQRQRSISVITSPLGHESPPPWTSHPSETRMFPGLVTLSARRQGSMSEKDGEIEGNRSEIHESESD